MLWLVIFENIPIIVLWDLWHLIFEFFKYYFEFFLPNHSCNSDSIIHFVTLAETCIFSKEIGLLCPLTWCNYVNSFCVGIMIYTADCITLFYHKVISWRVDLCLKEFFLQFHMSTWVEYTLYIKWGEEKSTGHAAFNL